MLQGKQLFGANSAIMIVYCELASAIATTKPLVCLRIVLVESVVSYWSLQRLKVVKGRVYQQIATYW